MKIQSKNLHTATEREEAKRDSMAHTDANSTQEASAAQSAKDEAAADQPAEQGGQG